MAVLAKERNSALTFEPDVFRKNCLFIIASIWTLNMMVSLVLLVIARTARTACGLTDRQTHRTTTVTLAVHARQGLIIVIVQWTKKNMKKWYCEPTHQDCACLHYHDTILYMKHKLIGICSPFSILFGWTISTTLLPGHAWRWPPSSLTCTPQSLIRELVVGGPYCMRMQKLSKISNT